MVGRDGIELRVAYQFGQFSRTRWRLSRTAFAQWARPVSYLAAWRMQKAAYLLEMGTLSIAQIAEQVGYTSELAFAKAFRRLMGRPPGAYARQHTRR